jgi:vitamin B12 transporter
MRLLFIVYGLCLMASMTVGQSADTLYLKEVAVYGLPVTTYVAGSKVEKIATGDRVATLGDALLREPSLYLKTYGNNQLTTIALRGTTASQTAVLWNGININSPTLGQTDFSLIPLFLFDEMSIHYGTASALYGSDAVGGSVMMGQSSPEFKRSPSFFLYQQIGSFGRISTGIKASYGNERWQFRTKIYRAFIENDFSYHSPAVGYRKKQIHAAVTNYGIDQQIHFKISETKTLAADILYTDNFRENQPAVTSIDANETLGDKNLRAAVNYYQHASWGVLHATSAFMRGIQAYTDDNTSTTITNQFTTMIHVNRSINTRSDLHYGLNYNQYTVSSSNFNHPREHRYDAFASYRYSVVEGWIVNVNMRQSVYAQRYAPFSPSIGTEIFLNHQENNSLKVRGQLARGFRVPTLNDRYWTPGGNQLTLPEDARHAEGGITWIRTFQNTKLKIDATGYKSWIDQMIVWMPQDDGIWSPTNLQKVNIRGAEFSSQLGSNFGSLKVKTGITYAFTQSLNKSGDPSIVNKQLAYVPVHNGNFFATASHAKNWNMGLNFMYTGIRYTTLDNTDYQSLPSYTLMDIFLSKKYAWDKLSIEVKGEVRNLLNVYYENLQNHAMPGRNYSISFLINFKHHHRNEKN